MTNEFQLFPDIRLYSGDCSTHADCGEIEVSLCIGGCCECRAGDEYFYLTAGSCLIKGRGGRYRTKYSPDYRGITLLIDARHSDSLAEMFNVQRLFADIRENERHIFFADDSVQRLAGELCSFRVSSRTAMLRVKAIELLMLLGERKLVRCERSEDIQRIGAFICENVSEHFTIPQLGELFGIAPHTLKADFSRYFGSSVYAYTKMRKMFRAAELLSGTDMKVIDIAEEVGYSNASKFASAFSSVMGRSPRNYRMEQKQVRSFANLVKQPISM